MLINKYTSGDGFIMALFFLGETKFAIFNFSLKKKMESDVKPKLVNMGKN